MSADKTKSPFELAHEAIDQCLATAAKVESARVDLACENHRLGQANANLQAIVDELRCTVSTKDVQITVFKAKLEAECDRRSRHLDEAGARSNALRVERDAAIARAEKAEAEYASLLALDCSVPDPRHAAFREKIAGLEGEILALREQLKTARKERDIRAQSRDHYCAETHRLRDEIAGLTRERDALKARLDRLEGALRIVVLELPITAESK